MKSSLAHFLPAVRLAISRTAGVVCAVALLGPINPCAAAPLTNADITKLLAAGLEESAVVATIRSNGGSFDTSADALIALKRAGASDAVIQAILAGPAATASGAGAPGAKPAQRGARSGGECVGEAPDGFILMVIDGAPRNVGTKAATMGSDASNLQALASGLTLGLVPVTVKQSLVVAGTRSSLRIKDRRPIFRDLATQAGTSPSDGWVLIRPDIGTRERTVQIGEASDSLLGGVKSRIEISADKVVALDYETVTESCTAGKNALSIYAAKPSQDLAPGEYLLFSPVGGRQVVEFAVE